MELAGWLDTTYKNLTASPNPGEDKTEPDHVGDTDATRTAAATWIEEVVDLSETLSDLNGTDKEKLVDEAADALRAGADLDGTVIAAVVATDGLADEADSAPERLRDFIVSRRPDAVDDSGLVIADYDPDDSHHTGYDYGTGGLDLGGEQQWGTNVDFSDTGLDLD
jgi:hypothetical protein